MLAGPAVRLHGRAAAPLLPKGPTVPVKRVATYDGAESLTAALAELEEQGATNILWGLAGNEYVITYTVRQKPGPKPRETR